MASLVPLSILFPPSYSNEEIKGFTNNGDEIGNILARRFACKLKFVELNFVCLFDVINMAQTN
jgi:hypothetical protein